MSDREIIITGDGSHTISIPELNVTYHSIHGALQESMHVFINEGLNYIVNKFPDQPINIFEMGFGTGLNAFLTAIEAGKKSVKIKYTSIDAFPLSVEEYSTLNYADLSGNEILLQQLHQCNWEEDVFINEYFTLRKEKDDLHNYTATEQFNIIYYDAFAPNAQAELWTKEIFKKLYNMLLPDGILITYCSKGDVRRAMQAAGFIVTKLPGPPRKREMLRAEKISLMSN